MSGPPVVCPFGKHKGKPVAAIPNDDLAWLGGLELRSLRFRGAVMAELERRGLEPKLPEPSGHELRDPRLRDAVEDEVARRSPTPAPTLPTPAAPGAEADAAELALAAARVLVAYLERLAAERER